MALPSPACHLHENAACHIGCSHNAKTQRNSFLRHNQRGADPQGAKGSQTAARAQREALPLLGRAGRAIQARTQVSMDTLVARMPFLLQCNVKGMETLRNPVQAAFSHLRSQQVPCERQRGVPCRLRHGAAPPARGHA